MLIGPAPARRAGQKGSDGAGSVRAQLVVGVAVRARCNGPRRLPCEAEAPAKLYAGVRPGRHALPDPARSTEAGRLVGW